MSEYCWVQVDDVGTPVRIFRTRKAAYAFGLQWIASWWRSDAVKSIRHQLWIRSKGECEMCGRDITEQNSEMHEKLHRGKGGEISFENSILICHPCHRHEHRDRNPRWSKGEKK